MLEPVAASGNLYANLPASPGQEEFIALLSSPTVKIERIVSTGHATPPGEWYDQEAMEWVAVLAGAAVLRFADEATPRRLARGDWIAIPPHARHRVEWTDPNGPTIWLAVHIRTG